MITIRLQRRGRKNDPSFRVVVLDSKKKVKTGNYLEMVGSYDPRSNKVELKAERITQWMAQGATVSDTVHNLLVSNKIIDAKKINVLPKKTVAKKEEPVAEVKAEAKPEPKAEAVAEVAELVAEADAALADVAPEAETPVESAIAEEAAAA